MMPGEKRVMLRTAVFLVFGFVAGVVGATCWLVAR